MTKIAGDRGSPCLILDPGWSGTSGTMPRPTKKNRGALNMEIRRVVIAAPRPPCKLPG